MDFIYNDIQLVHVQNTPKNISNKFLRFQNKIMIMITINNCYCDNNVC